MGVIYSVACKECKVVRDLDKFYGAREISDRKEALDYGEFLAGSKRESFRSGLLVSFMAEHIGHDCVFFNEHSGCQEELEPFFDNDYKEDFDYWETD